MQTFLPYADYRRSVAVLDDKRLGKQRVETLQIMQVLLGLRWKRPPGVIEAYEPKAWKNHPAVTGWRGFESSLADYQRVTCAEWTSRGFADTCLASTLGLFEASGLPDDRIRPAWTQSPAVHRSHRSNLIRKDPLFYRPLFPDVPDDLDYVWPREVIAAAAAEVAQSSPPAGPAAAAEAERGRAADSRSVPAEVRAEAAPPSTARRAGSGAGRGRGSVRPDVSGT